MLEEEIEKKELPCLKCGKLIQTYIYKRLCAKCNKSNESIRDITGRFPTIKRSAKQHKFKEG